MALSPWGAPPMAPVRLTHPRDSWAAAKQIDGLGGEWSYKCFTYRALNFHLSHLPPLWAEPLRGFDELYEETQFNVFAYQAGIPETDLSSISATFTVFRSVFSAPSNDWPLPEEGEIPIGRHSVAISGIRDENTLAFHHGWSEWPENYAAGYISREYFDHYATELWTMRRYGSGPLYRTIDSLVESAGSPEYATIWRKSGRRGSESVANNPDLRIRWWESFSIQDHAPSEIVALTLPRNIRVAVALLIYEPEEATIMDLFVWPGYRRRGYASMLEEVVAARAIARGARHISAIVLDADVVRDEEASTQFLVKKGYEIERFPGSQVRIQGRRLLGSDPLAQSVVNP